MRETDLTWQVIMMKGVANQSCSNTWPVGQMKVRLKPTGGAGVISGVTIYHLT